jgi:tetratricopeptide (TPR) repeat protein
MGDSSAAITAFVEALRIAEQLGAALIKIVALSKLGEVYAQLEEYEHAKTHFLKAKSLAQTCGYAFSDAQASLELAKLFMKQRQYSAAQPLLNEGLLASQHAASKVLEQQYHEVLAALYKALSNLTLSLQHAKLAESLQACKFPLMAPLAICSWSLKPDASFRDQPQRPANPTLRPPLHSGAQSH